MDPEVVQKLQEFQEWFLVHEVSDKAIYIIGGIIFLALLVVLLSKKIKVPIVVGYVFLGVALSINIIEILPFLTLEQKEWYAFTVESFDYISHLALAFIAFTIGSELSIKILKNLGKNIVYVVLLEATGAVVIVTLAILAIGKPLYFALLLGS